jgi:hypothetical protein
MQIKDVTRDDAEQIRKIMQGPAQGPICRCGDAVELQNRGYYGLSDVCRYYSNGFHQGLTRLERIDHILHTCGVERIAAGSNQRSPAILYCNAGDPYTTTVLKVRGRFRVGCLGALVERGKYA